MIRTTSTVCPMTNLPILRQYLQLDPTIPSGLRWIKSPSNSITINQPAGRRASRGYYSLRFRGRSYQCHQLILLFNEIYPPSGCTQVDHIDRNPSNNLIGNLRWVTPSVNVQNCRVSGKVPYRYVRRRTSGKYEAQYKHPKTKQKMYVGVFDNPTIAHKAALVHRLEHHWLS